MIKKLFRKMLIKKPSWEKIEQDLIDLKLSCGSDTEKWQEQAKSGNQTAINMVAQLSYMTNKENALEMFKILSDHYYAPAQLNLGLLYIAGNDFPKDYKKGYSLIKDSAIEGHAPAFYQLALCYKNSIGVKEDQAEYIKYMHMAKDLEYPEAYADLGEFYFVDSEKKDLELAYKFLEKSSHLGIISSYYRVSQFYLNGLSKVKQDTVQAFIWLTLALKESNEKEHHDKTSLENTLNALETLKKFLSKKDLSEIPSVLKALEQQIISHKNNNKWLNMI